MINQSSTQRRLFVALTAVAGEAAGSGVFLIPEEDYDTASLAVFPGAGGTAKIEISLEHPDNIAAMPKWIEWSEGAVSVDTGIDLNLTFTAIRLIATTEDASATLVLKY